MEESILDNCNLYVRVDYTTESFSAVTIPIPQIESTLMNKIVKLILAGVRGVTNSILERLYRYISKFT